MNGMEMMINALVKSLGLNPEDLKQQALAIQQIIVGLDARLKMIEDTQTEILTNLERLNNGPANGYGTRGIQLSQIEDGGRSDGARSEAIDGTGNDGSTATGTGAQSR